MTMKEIEFRTPNGLHDAYLLGISTDYNKRTLRLDIDWLVAPTSKKYEERNGYQFGSLFVSGLRYYVVEAPVLGNGESPDQINGFETDVDAIERCKLPDVEEGIFRHSIYLGYWESFIHFAGSSAEVHPSNLLVRDMEA